MQIANRHILGTIPGTIGRPAIISSLLVLPFMILELKNRRGFDEGFPVALFAVMWLLPVSFILILRPIARKLLRARDEQTANPLSLLAGIAALIFIAWFWVTLLVDQTPCFLGVPNCD